MRWLGRWFGRGHGLRWGAWMTGTIALAPVGCSDDDGYFDGGDTTEGYVEPMVDYSECKRSMRDPTCEGVDCGTSAQAQDYLQIMLEEVDDAGHTDQFAPVVAEYYALTNELRIDYQLQVSWFRMASSISLPVPESEYLLRQELASHVAGWVVPASVATPEEITAEVESCHALLTYDHCEDNHDDFVVYSSYDWERPDCVYKTTYAVVDADDGSTLECVVERELPCV